MNVLISQEMDEKLNNEYSPRNTVKVIRKQFEMTLLENCAKWALVTFILDRNGKSML